MLETAGATARRSMTACSRPPNPHRERLAHALVEENPSKAAGIKASYSEKAASDCARRIEKLPVLIARIEFLGPKALEKREITVKRIAKACSQIALGDMSQHLHLNDAGEP